MKTLTRLAISNDKRNKTRSILIIISIILSTMLLTALATYCYGALKSKVANAAEQYGTFQGMFRGVTHEEYNELKLRSEFSKTGISAFAATVQDDDTFDASLAFCDDESRDMGNLNKSLQQGKFPESKDEIAAGTGFFKALGYDNVKVNDKITLSMRPDQDHKFEAVEFKVSGILKDPSQSTAGKRRYTAYISEDFYNSVTEENRRVYMMYFRLDDSISMNSSNSEKVITNIGEQCGVNAKNVVPNKGYLLWTLDPGYENVMVFGVVGICVIIFSVVIIYNIFQVGITDKIQEYGKIKAIGATKKQMKKIIFREGMVLSLIGVPIGILGGYILVNLSFDWIMEQAKVLGTSESTVKISLFSLPILVLSGVISFLTVFLSLRKPMKIVSSISPVEAIRYTGNKGKRKGSTRKGSSKVTMGTLVSSNLSQNKRRTIGSILTMGLSCVLFIVLSSFISSVDSDYEARRHINHGDIQLELEYSIDDKAYPENNLDNILKDNPLNNDLLEKIKAIDGVKEVKTRYIMAAERDGQIQPVAALSSEDLDYILKTTSQIGEFDYDKLSEEDGIIFGWSAFMENYKVEIGKDPSIKIWDGERYIDFNNPVAGAVGNSDTRWAITEDTYNRLLIKDKSIGYIWVDCGGKNVDQVENQIKDLIAGEKHVEIDTYKNQLAVTQMSTKVMSTMAYSFLIIIGLIGFMNLANTMIMNIITRKHEFGVLQAVGMTNKQLSRVLFMEGFIYVLGTIAVSLAVGIPLGYGLFKYAKSERLFGINIYHFPVVPVVLMVSALILLQIILSAVLSRNVRKESLVERIRFQE